ncbi:MAG TPA: hypothetical protein VG844_17100 [Terracidiphilus sp.]|nr:hypothetical protein [Terracidiphilus sp.]
MQESHAQPASVATRERPWLFALLIAPTAIIDVGLVTGALSFLLRREGIDPARGSEIVALLTIPHTIYFLWCPVSDFWMRRRTWILISSAAAAAILLLAFHQPSLGSAWAIRFIFISYCLGLLVAASCGGIMGTFQSDVNRRRASSAYQSGSLFFSAITVFVLVALADRLPLSGLGWVASAMIVAPALAAFLLPPEAAPVHQNFRAAFARIRSEFRSTFRQWNALPYLLLITFPMGSGAMIGLLPGLAADFGVSGAQVAWMNGVAGALLTTLGTLAAAFIPVRLRAPLAFPLAGMVNACALAILALAPLRPAIYFAGSALYLFTIGCCWALFTGVALDFLGGSGKTGGARYAIINSIGNLPVAYMTYLDGRGYAYWGPRGMPAVDAVLSASGATLLLLLFLVRGVPRRIKIEASD